MNGWVILVGIFMAILTFLLNAWYTHRNDRREQELKDLEKEELLSRILAQGRKL